MEIEATFILGAGSNKFLEFPLGYEVFLKTIDDILVDTESDLYKIFLRINEISTTNENFVIFTRSLKKSSLNSIDQFIFHHNQFEIFAKIIYSLYLIKAENEEFLYKNKFINWYDYVWNSFLYHEDINKFPKNRIAFITFNYDRSLEHFLYEAIYSTYSSDLNLDDLNTRLEVFKRIPIIHIYGRLSDLSQENPENNIKYGNQDFLLSFQNDQLQRIDNLMPLLKKSCDNIELIFDRRKNRNPRLSEIFDIISHSKQLIFLGFDFNQNNLNNLFNPEHVDLISKQLLKSGFIYNFDGNDKQIVLKTKLLNAKYDIKFNNIRYDNIIDYLKNEIDIPLSHDSPSVPMDH